LFTVFLIAPYTVSTRVCHASSDDRSRRCIIGPSPSAFVALVMADRHALHRETQIDKVLLCREHIASHQRLAKAIP